MEEFHGPGRPRILFASRAGLTESRKGPAVPEVDTRAIEVPCRPSRALLDAGVGVDRLRLVVDHGIGCAAPGDVVSISPVVRNKSLPVVAPQ